MKGQLCHAITGAGAEMNEILRYYLSSQLLDDYSGMLCWINNTVKNGTWSITVSTKASSLSYLKKQLAKNQRQESENY
ncbi:hypothetical protein SCA6_009492 [Theobroma cacao]